MHPQQLALNFTASVETRPDQERLHALIAALKEAGTWLTRRQLELLGFDERELRDLGEHDEEGCIFSYPGSPGYKHFDLVTDAEFDRCIALKNQGEKMTAKWVRYQRRWHHRFKRGSADEAGA